MGVRFEFAFVVAGVHFATCDDKRGVNWQTSEGIAHDDSWLHFPTPHGAVLVHSDCVHRFDEDIHIEVTRSGGDLLTRGSQQQELPPCPHSLRWPDASSEKLSSQASQPQYYSDWVAYAVATGKFGYMSSDWVVPAAPKSTGPVPGLSSVYFFNGLENGGGQHGKADYILQPVLTYGKSGCIVDPLNFFKWHFVSFSVTAAGRAYCGKRLSVEEGERIRGIMSLDSDKKTWTTSSIRLKDNETSLQRTNLGDSQPDAAYVTLETMVNYNCQTFPADGSVTFEDNYVKDRSGNHMQASWKKMLRHTECNQDVHIDADGDVAISWNTQLPQLIHV